MKPMTKLGRYLGLIAAGALLLAACQPAAQPAPTTPPAKPTTPAAPPTPAPAVTAAPAPATPAPAASPAAKPGAELTGTIKIVSSLPRTGSSKGQTDTLVNAIKMALEEAGNKVGNATIVYEDWDDATAARGAWDAAKEAENANNAVNDRDIMVYIGTFNSGAAQVAIPILCPANLVMISPANTYPGLTKNIEGVTEANEPGKYYPNCPRNYTRVVPADDIQGAAGAQWAKDLGATRVYVLDDTELYGHGLAVAFANAAKRLGLQVTGPEGIDRQATDYRALANKIKGTNPDLVYFGGITQNNAGKLWKDLRSVLGNQVKLMGPDGIFEEAFLRDAGDAAEDTYLTFGGLTPDKYTGKAAEWRDQYVRKYGSQPEVYAIYGYEATKVALDAIARAGTKDRAKIRDAVFATKDFNKGVLGTWSFDQNGDTTLTTMTGSQVKGGKFEFAKELQAPRP